MRPTYRVVLAFGITLMLALALPCREAHAQSDLLLYVPNSTANTVSVFSTNADGTLTAVTTIAVGTSPQGVAVRGDQAFAYVTNSTSGTVSVIDTKTQTIVQTFTVGTTPFGAAISPDGTRLYVANLGSNTVSVLSVNATTGQLSTVTTVAATDPRNLVVSPDGSRLYVVNQGADNVQVFNTATNAVVATVTVGDQPLGVAVNPAGTRVYVTNFSDSTVSVIDTATNTVIATVATGSGPHKVIVSPDGTKFYVTNQTAGTVSQFDASTNTAITTAIASGAVTVGIGISPDGTFLYTTNAGGSDNVAIFSVGATGALTAVGTIAAGNDPNSIGLCGNASAMLATGGIFVANTAGALNCAGSAGPTFTGGTLLVNGSSLSFTSPMSLGSGGGTIDTNGNDSTVSGVISGTGGLTKAGAGVLTLSAANTYSGATTVSVGTLRAGAANAFSSSSATTVSSGATLDLNSFGQTIASLAGGGSVTLGSATLTTGGDNTSTTFSGVISGTGGVTKSGTGTFTLSGANTYTGTTTVSTGTLSVTGSLASPTTVSSGATLSNAGTVSGTVTNSGTVSNTSTISGAVTNSGTLTNTGTLSGAVTNTGTLTNTDTVSGAVTNTGTLTNTGTVSGAVTNSETLTNNGTITSATTSSGGTVGGTGLFGALAVTGGTLAPGNSIGTLRVAGAFSFASGATYEVEVNAAGETDLIQVTGTATLNGATVRVLAASGDYRRRTSYTILTATDGVTGTFGTVTSSLAFLTPSLFYDPTAVRLVLTRNDVTYASLGETGNQRAVGAALDTLSPGASGDLLTLIDAVTILSAAEVPGALRALSGEAHASAQTLSLVAGERYLATLRDRFAAPHASGGAPRTARAPAFGGPDDRRYASAASAATTDASVAVEAMPSGPGAWWLVGHGGGGGLDSTSQARGVNYTVAGTAGGVDAVVSETVRLGVSLGYGHTWARIDTLGDRLGFDTYQIGGYGRWDAGVVEVDGLVAYAFDDYRAQRAIVFGSIDRRASADGNVQTLATGLEVGRTVPWGRLYWRPAAGLTHRHLWFGSFTENRADAANLAVDHEDLDSLGASVELRAGARVALGAERVLVPEARVRYTRELLDAVPSVRAEFAGTTGAAFTVHGLEVPADRVELGARVVASITSRLGLVVDASGDVSPARSSYAVSALLNFAW